MRVCVCVCALMLPPLCNNITCFLVTMENIYQKKKKKKERKTSHKGTFAQRTVCKVLLEMSFFI